MRKAILFIILCLAVVPVQAQELEFSQQDIDKFLAFADEFMAMAREYIDDPEINFIDQLYYQDSEELMTAIESFLEDRGWSYLKMNDFLYVATVAMEYLVARESLGPEMAGMLDEILVDIPPEVIELFSKNNKALMRYFDIEDYAAMLGEMEDYGDLEIPEYIGEMLPEEDLDALPPEVVFGLIPGIWELGSDSMYVWNFQEDGNVFINEVSPVAAQVSGWEGTYEVNGREILIQIDTPFPFPVVYTFAGDRLEGGDDYLVRR